MKLATLALLAASVNAVDTWENGPEFEIEWDSDKEAMKIEAEVPEGQWLGIAYGQNMNNVDMLFMGRNGDGEFKDMWATQNGPPNEDQDFSYFDVERKKEGDEYKFKAWRKLDTGDSANDYVLNCGQVYDFKWVGNDASGTMNKHNKVGMWKLTINEDCTMSGAVKLGSLMAAGALSIAAYYL